MQWLNELRKYKLRKIILKLYATQRFLIYFAIVGAFLLLQSETAFVLVGLLLIMSVRLVGYISGRSLAKGVIFLNPESNKTIQNLERINRGIRRNMYRIVDILLWGTLVWTFANRQGVIETAPAASLRVIKIITPFFIVWPIIYCIFRMGFKHIINKQTKMLLDKYNYKIIVHVSGATGTIYQIEQWRKIFAELNKAFPMLVIVRQKHFWWYCADLEVPAIFVPTDLKGTSQCVDIALKESTRIVLYLNNSAYNHHLLILRKLIHIHINHGDSDKGPNALNTSRDYDYLYIAGQASVDRHVKAHWDPRQLRTIGRPQILDLIDLRDSTLDERKDLAKDGRKIVLYAPTFEGGKITECYSSFLRMGKKIITDIVKSGKYRLIVKLHPYTGVFSKEYKKLKDEMEKFINEHADKGHIWVPQLSPDLYRYFALSDIVIGDISSVCIDYLSLNKPLIAANPFLLDSSSDHVLNSIPFWRGSYVLDYNREETFDVVRMLNSVFEQDVKKKEREKTALYYLGELVFTPKKLMDNLIREIKEVIENGKALKLSEEYIPEAHLRWAFGDERAFDMQQKNSEVCQMPKGQRAST